MFGKNKASFEEIQELKNNLEKQNEFFTQMASKKPVVEATQEELRESHRQMEADLRQLDENEKTITEYARDNVALAATLCHSMDELIKRMKESEEKNQKLLEAIRNQTKAAQNLVEENKHFTSPSKYLNDVPGSLRSTNEGYLSQLEVMSDVGKKMGVLALNAAIEAGRLGEGGKQFVAAAEDIRVQSTLYDSLIAKMKDKISESDKKIGELEEQLRHLVGLLKENNVSTANLMKLCMDTEKKAGESLTDAFSGEVAELREKNVDLKNSQDEILKTQERNQLQMEDITSEHMTQVSKMDEIISTVTPFLEKNRITEEGE